MRALTVWEPWASFLVAGVKRHETRAWRTDYRGPLLVHAAKRWGPDQRRLVLGSLWEAVEAAGLVGRFSPGEPRAPGRRSGGRRPDSLGCIVGLVRLEGCLRTEDEGPTDRLDRLLGDWRSGRWAWRVRNPLDFRDPVPCRGAQGLWTPPARVLRAVREEMRRSPSPHPGSMTESQENRMTDDGGTS